MPRSATACGTLSIVFGDGRALAEVRAIALNTQKADDDARRAAVRQLIEGARPIDLDALLEKLVLDRALTGPAARGLAMSTIQLAGGRFQAIANLFRDQSATVANSLLQAAAVELLDAVAQGTVARSLIMRCMPGRFCAMETRLKPALERHLG